MDLSKVPKEVLDRIPLQPPPPGVVSNFEHPVSRAAEVQITTYVFLPLMVIFVLLRLYTRLKITPKFGADDYLSVVSAICMAAYCGVYLHLVEPNRANLAKHSWDIPIGHLSFTWLNWNLASLMLYPLAALFTKVSLLALYLRIFPPPFRSRWLMYAGIVFIALFYVAMILAPIKPFLPGQPSSLFERAKGNSDVALLIGKIQGIVGVLTDFYILLIPLQLVSTLRLPLARKLAVYSVFLTGLMACICAVVGAYYRFEGANSTDVSWKIIPASTLSIVELNTGNICSCMPVIYPLMKSIAKSKMYLRVERRVFGQPSRTQDRNEGVDHVSDKPQALPEIPKGTLSGVKTFIRKMSSSKVQTTSTTNSARTYDDFITSANDDYHAQLKNTTV